MIQINYSNEEIIRFVKESTSYKQVIEKLGLKYGGSSYRRIKEIISKLNIDISHFTGKLWSKGKTSVTDSRLGKSFDEYFCENSKCNNSFIKELIIKNKLIVCCCGECNLSSMWNNKPIVLHLDHINGVRNDNRLINLRFLCPNCHSQTETYCKGHKLSKISDDIIIDVLKNSNTFLEVNQKLNRPRGYSTLHYKKLMEQHNIKFLKYFVQRQNQILQCDVEG